PSDVRDALAKNNYLAALGRTKGSMVSVNLVANTNLQNVDEFRQLVVKEQNGVIVRLGEIADVELGAENYDEDVRFNGETATFMGVWVLPTANALDVIRRVRAVMPEIAAQVPAGMKVGIPYDSTEYIDDAIIVVENVERHIQLGKRPMEAALVAARELVGPIIAMTITLAAVYAPIGLQGGLTGALFREFALTLAGAVIVSGFVALTLSP